VTIWETFEAGGPVMKVILFCSVVAMATFLERMWALRRSRVVPAALCVEVSDLVRQGRFEDALTACRTSPSGIGRVLESALELRGAPRERIRERLEETGRREVAELERFTNVLGTIASISPLLGLLGTVGGMIVTFSVIETQGLGDTGALAGGISQALLTTFAGLTVGIPSLVGHRYLLSRIDDLTLDLEEVSSGVVELMLSAEDAA